MTTSRWDAESAFEDLAVALKRRSRKAFEPQWGALRPSAVMAPIWMVEGRPRVVFTQRHQNLRHHAGQISFPGGAEDATDADSLGTALRELEEELGVAKGAVQVLGELDEIPTPTGFRIAPYVGRLVEGVQLNPNPAEVDQLIVVPLEELFVPGRPRIEKRMVQGRGWDVYFYETGSHVIWGATAHILRNLLEEMAELRSWQRWTQT